MRVKYLSSLLMLCFLSLACSTSPVLAQKNGKGGGKGGGGNDGGGQDPVLTGLVYHTGAGPQATTPDGSVTVTTQGVNASYLLHGGEKWFLGYRTYDGDTITVGDPPRDIVETIQEIYAVNDSGLQVPLFQIGFGQDLAPPSIRWAKDDGFISFMADLDSAVEVTAYELFTLDIAWIEGIPVPAEEAIFIDTPGILARLSGPYASHDFSADASRVAYEVENFDGPATKRIVVLDLVSGLIEPIGPGVRPDWSPVRDELLYIGPDSRQTGLRDVYVVSPTGALLKRIADKRNEFFAAVWGPGGDHLAISVRDGKTSPSTWPLVIYDLLSDRGTTILDDAIQYAWR